MYRSLARGPCLEEYATRLERECDEVWQSGRQGCEHISLTGNPCRLNIGHEQKQEQPLSRESMLLHGNKHNSGATFIHACNCGKSQMSRDDPFDIMVSLVKRQDEHPFHISLISLFRMPISISTLNSIVVQQKRQVVRSISKTQHLERNRH